MPNCVASETFRFRSFASLLIISDYSPSYSANSEARIHEAESFLIAKGAGRVSLPLTLLATAELGSCVSSDRVCA